VPWLSCRALCFRKSSVLLVWGCVVIVVGLGDGELCVYVGFSFSEICLNSRAKGPVMMFRIEAGHKSQSRVEEPGYLSVWLKS
jgi:hypothetical protein